jgi:hypothetical protein
MRRRHRQAGCSTLLSPPPPRRVNQTEPLRSSPLAGREFSGLLATNAPTHRPPPDPPRLSGDSSQAFWPRTYRPTVLPFQHSSIPFPCPPIPLPPSEAVPEWGRGNLAPRILANSATGSRILANPATGNHEPRTKNHFALPVPPTQRTTSHEGLRCGRSDRWSALPYPHTDPRHSAGTAVLTRVTFR